MNLEIALDDDTMVSLDEAVWELENHGFQAFYGDGKLHVRDEVQSETICDIVDGEVQANKILIWLGY